MEFSMRTRTRIGTPESTARMAAFNPSTGRTDTFLFLPAAKAIENIGDRGAGMPMARPWMAAGSPRDDIKLRTTGLEGARI